MSDTLTAAWPWWQRAAAGVGVSLLVGGAIGVIVRLLMRAVVLLVDHEPSFSLPASVAIVLLFAVGVIPGGVLVALGLRRTGLLVLSVTALLHLSQIVVVGLDEGAIRLLTEPSPGGVAIVLGFLLAPPAAAIGVWRLASAVARR